VNAAGKTWQRFFIACSALVLIGTLTAVALHQQHFEVCISAWDREVHLVTRAKTVGEALKQANIMLSSGDLVEPSIETKIQDGMKISVERSQPVFVFSAGQVRTVLTAAKTVSSVLEQAGVTVGPDDITYPGLGEKVPSDNRIRVVKVTFGEVTEEKQIPYDTVKQEDPSLEAGLTRLKKEGTPGIMKVTYTVRYEDGKEVSRQEKSSVRVKDPSSRIVLVGTSRQVSRGGENIRFERALEVTATAYCPCTICCGPYANGYTHTGIPARKGVIAVDPAVIPLGTRVYVEGYGFAVAADTGSAIKGQRVDVCFDTHPEALSWGMRKVKVYILQ